MVGFLEKSAFSKRNLIRFFFLFFFRTRREKSERFGQRERKSPERKREGERESVNLTRVCVLRSQSSLFSRGEKSSLHTHIYISQHTHIYIFKKKKTEMMASSQTLSFARAVAPSPRKLTRKSTLSFSNKRSSSIKISASSIPIHIEYCEK